MDLKESTIDEILAVTKDITYFVDHRHFMTEEIVDYRFNTYRKGVILIIQTLEDGTWDLFLGHEVKESSYETLLHFSYYEESDFPALLKKIEKRLDEFKVPF